MIRLLLSFIILTLVIVYLLTPTIKYFKKIFKSEGKRIAKAYENTNTIEEKDEEK